MKVNNPFKTDITEQPIYIIKTKDNGYKFYPRNNIEAITAYLEFEREKKQKDKENYCGAV